MDIYVSNIEQAIYYYFIKKIIGNDEFYIKDFLTSQDVLKLYLIFYN